MYSLFFLLSDYPQTTFISLNAFIAHILVIIFVRKISLYIKDTVTEISGVDQGVVPLFYS